MLVFGGVLFVLLHSMDGSFWSFEEKGIDLTCIVHAMFLEFYKYCIFMNPEQCCSKFQEQQPNLTATVIMFDDQVD